MRIKVPTSCIFETLLFHIASSCGSQCLNLSFVTPKATFLVTMQYCLLIISCAYHSKHCLSINKDNSCGIHIKLKSYCIYSSCWCQTMHIAQLIFFHFTMYILKIFSFQYFFFYFSYCIIFYFIRNNILNTLSFWYSNWWCIKLPSCWVLITWTPNLCVWDSWILSLATVHSFALF